MTDDTYFTEFDDDFLTANVRSISISDVDNVPDLFGPNQVRRLHIY